MTHDAVNSSPADLKGATLYLDCFAGIAGDMTLGALLDLGVPESVVRDALACLHTQPYTLHVRTVRKGALLARHVEVVEITPADDHHHHDHHHDHDHDDHDHHHPDPTHAKVGHHPHVHYSEIRALIEGARQNGLEVGIIERALSMFDRLAAVEATLHGVPLAEVAFHEVGAVDSIVDIVGTAAALHHLQPRRVVSRVVPLGSGTVRTAHGILPVPAPATLALLHGVPVESGGPPFELTTPTGAVILAANVRDYGPLPAMRVVATGHGAGTRELTDRPNLLRVIAGHEAENPSSENLCVVVEANIDDMNPQLYEPLLASLFQAGARDGWLTAVQMKKGRPGVVVSVLCDPQNESLVSAVLLRESTTLGVRSHAVQRRVLDRKIVEVTTEFGVVAVKLGYDPASGALWNIAPEFSSCVERARAHDRPIKEVIAAAVAAFHRSGR
jgi:uncharacterized protein (TIGR00299 family) protein